MSDKAKVGYRGAFPGGFASPGALPEGPQRGQDLAGDVFDGPLGQVPEPADETAGVEPPELEAERRDVLRSDPTPGSDLGVSLPLVIGWNPLDGAELDLLYPGTRRCPLAERVTAVSLTDLAEGPESLLKTARRR